ncbi:MAG TPA: hypothetical protein VMT34_17965 [Aggregatilineales bacterium]|nr:hypothetical protein [Aggregatilineales bacterium]
MSSVAGIQQAATRASQSVQIEPVTDPKGVMEVIEFPFKLYKNDHNWVPPFIEERRDFLDPKKNPFYEHGKVQLFLARRHGEVVGTIGAAINYSHNTVHNEKAGAFGYFETIDDQEVASVLLRAAEEWVRAEGMTIIRGPMTFSLNDECTLLVSGDDDPPVAMMTYNPLYYAGLIEAAGYQKAMDFYAYLGDLDERLHNAPPKVFHAAEKAAARRGITVRKGRMSEFNKEAEIIRSVMNQAWSKNWGFVPLTDHEVEHLGKNLKQLVDPDLVLIAETSDGKPVGISLTLPDVNQALKRAGGGHMFPFGLLKYLWYAKINRKINRVRLVLMGVVEDYRMLGIDAIFYVQTARIALSKGYYHLEGSWILETNTMMNRIIERLGGRRYKTYRIYEKNV